MVCIYSVHGHMARTKQISREGDLNRRLDYGSREYIRTKVRWEAVVRYKVPISARDWIRLRGFANRINKSIENFYALMGELLKEVQH